MALLIGSQTGTQEEKLATTQQVQSTTQQPTTQQSTTGNELSAEQKPVSVQQQAADPLKSMYDRTMETLRASETSTPLFQSDYDKNIQELYQKITGREKFNYDASTDPLYGQYREAYIQQGRQAMRDSMGQTAALTGGYGNSYGSVAGQQTYEAYLGRLNDVLPELEQQAYNRYLAEGDRLNQQYALASDMRNTQYGQFRDALGDFKYDQAWDAEQAFNRAQLGDWAKYKELYGDESAKIAQILSNPQAAWANGVATPDEIYKYTGAYPIGYTPPGAGVVGGGGIDNTWGYVANPATAYAKGGWDPKNQTHMSQQIYNNATDGDYYK